MAYIDRNGQSHAAQLLTNRLDLTSEVIAVLYRHRWQVELFFRWLTCLANLRHFFSESQNGITLQLYVALIATLLLTPEAEAPPSVYDFAQAGYVISGLIPRRPGRPWIIRRSYVRPGSRDATLLSNLLEERRVSYPNPPGTPENRERINQPSNLFQIPR